MISCSFLLFINGKMVLLQKIGESWLTNLDDLRKLEKFYTDKNFLIQIQKVKQVSALDTPLSPPI